MAQLEKISNAAGNPVDDDTLEGLDGEGKEGKSIWIPGCMAVNVMIRGVGISGQFVLEASFDGVENDGSVGALTENTPVANIKTSATWPCVRVNVVSLSGTIDKVFVYGVPRN